MKIFTTQNKISVLIWNCSQISQADTSRTDETEQSIFQKAKLCQKSGTSTELLRKYENF